MEENKPEEEVKNTEKSEKFDTKCLGAALGALGLSTALFPSGGRCHLVVEVHVGDNIYNYNGNQPGIIDETSV